MDPSVTPLPNVALKRALAIVKQHTPLLIQVAENHCARTGFFAATNGSLQRAEAALVSLPILCVACEDEAVLEDAALTAASLLCGPNASPHAAATLDKLAARIPDRVIEVGAASKIAAWLADARAPTSGCWAAVLEATRKLCAARPAEMARDDLGLVAALCETLKRRASAGLAAPQVRNGRPKIVEALALMTFDDSAWWVFTKGVLLKPGWDVLFEELRTRWWHSVDDVGAINHVCLVMGSLARRVRDLRDLPPFAFPRLVALIRFQVRHRRAVDGVRDAVRARSFERLGASLAQIANDTVHAMLDQADAEVDGDVDADVPGPMDGRSPFSTIYVKQAVQQEAFARNGAPAAPNEIPGLVTAIRAVATWPPAPPNNGATSTGADQSPDTIRLLLKRAVTKSDAAEEALAALCAAADATYCADVDEHRALVPAAVRAAQAALGYPLATDGALQLLGTLPAPT